MQEVTWDDTVLNGINYLNKSVLQVPFLLMTLMRYVTPTLDEMYVSCSRHLAIQNTDKPDSWNL